MEEMLVLIKQIEKSAPSLTRTVQLLERMEQSGALETFVELIETLHAARTTMGDSMVSRLGERVTAAMEIMDPVLVKEAADRVVRVTSVLAEAREVAAKDTSTVSPWDLLTAPREPEIQFMLRWMLATARRLPKALE